MRTSSILLALLIQLVLSACASKPATDYWVPGLTLPKDVTIVNKSEVTNSSEILKSLGDQDWARQVDKLLVVAFDCPSGWGAVRSHVDTCLKRQGYTDVSSEGPNYQKLAKAAAKDPRIATFLESQREYTKSGEPYRVILWDSSLGGIAGQAQSAGTLVLHVCHLK